MVSLQDSPTASRLVVRDVELVVCLGLPTTTVFAFTQGNVQLHLQPQKVFARPAQVYLDSSSVSSMFAPDVCSRNKKDSIQAGLELL